MEISFCLGILNCHMRESIILEFASLMFIFLDVRLCRWNLQSPRLALSRKQFPYRSDSKASLPHCYFRCKHKIVCNRVRHTFGNFILNIVLRLTRNNWCFDQTAPPVCCILTCILFHGSPRSMDIRCHTGSNTVRGSDLCCTWWKINQRGV